MHRSRLSNQSEWLRQAASECNDGVLMRFPLADLQIVIRLRGTSDTRSGEVCFVGLDFSLLFTGESRTGFP